MIIVRDEYAVYHTEESTGYDIAIKEPANRYTVIPVDSIPDLISDLQEILMERSETESVWQDFDSLKEDW